MTTHVAGTLAHGMATIWDADVLIWVTSQIVGARNAGQLALAQQGTILAKGTVDDVALRIRAAKSPEGELLRSRAAFSRSEIDEQRAMANLGTARQRLAAVWGSARPDYIAVRADLYRFPPLQAFDKLAARLDGNPDFLRFVSAARLRDAELRLVSSLQKPDLSVSGGIRRLEETQDEALVMGISVPLFSGRRAAPAIAEAAALRELVEVEREAARIQARTQLYDLYEQLRQAVRETETLQRDVMPQLEEALKATEYAYERGRYGYLELVDAQRSFLDARAAAIDAAANGQELLAEIERLTGEPLVDGDRAAVPAPSGSARATGQ